MDIDKPVTARQLAWILWGPVAMTGLLTLMIYIMKETRTAAPVAAVDQNMTELTAESMAEIENQARRMEAEANANLARP